MAKRNKNSKWLWLFFLAILVAAGFYLYSSRNAKAPTPDAGQFNQKPVTAQNNQTAVAPTSTKPASATGQAAAAPATAKKVFSSGDNIDGGPDIQVLEVDFTDSGFQPKSISINPGDWIFFKNNSTKTFLPISVALGTAKAYSGFNATQSFAPGKQYKFQFTDSGSWGIANQLSSGVNMVVNVAAK